MKIKHRLNISLIQLKTLTRNYLDRQVCDMFTLIRETRNWLQQYILPLYPESPKDFLAIKLLLETSDNEIPATQENCLNFCKSIDRFAYHNRNEYIRFIATTIEDLVILCHHNLTDPYQGYYQYYYCLATDEVVLLGKIATVVTLDGAEWNGKESIFPAQRSILQKIGAI